MAPEAGCGPKKKTQMHLQEGLNDDTRRQSSTHWYSHNAPCRPDLSTTVHAALGIPPQRGFGMIMCQGLHYCHTIGCNAMNYRQQNTASKTNCTWLARGGCLTISSMPQHHAFSKLHSNFLTFISSATMRLDVTLQQLVNT